MTESDLKYLAYRIVESIDRAVSKTCEDKPYLIGSNIGIGASGSPTTYIDKIAEDTAIKIIKKAGNPVNLLSEESGYIDLNSDHTFILDPVDGTRNATRGIPFYSVSLAIGRKRLSDVEYGIVRNIPTGDTYTATRGEGAYLNNKKISVSDMPSKDILSSLTLGKNIDSVTNRLSKLYNVRAFGSCSLEMCLVATGSLDFYMAGKEYMRIVDIAASTLIVREAGGIVTNIKGVELDMDLNLDDRTSVIAASTRKVVNEYIIPSMKNKKIK
ncbi:MAG: inositol monophosphatase family protein [Candidatus Thermoplasmatota archaeon]